MDLARAVRARERVLNAFNREQSDFATLREWNDYLERREELIFNLTEGIDVTATEAAIAEHRRVHGSEIAALNARRRAASGFGDASGAEADGGYVPEAANAMTAMPVPTSAVRRGLEATSLGYDENTEEGRRARAEAIARACGFDGKAFARLRCVREAFATIWAGA
ncbi:CDK-activating kinase assembly factor MAT1-domain-containing protein [Ostreococcus tauri]|uniref:CDK-activating kinase assembly factor MAT1-domain-containing protein n=1 Tax=Ostreococcus tauri TaxID=70448 RepID=A0A1Y5IED2_OSTTA|nr:CDK-activating kinase assembly factor MAT1-domain-containing protein [Ostreococcus tauri]